MQRFSFLLMMVLAFSFIDLVSQDNPKSRERIETAKKMIMGVVSGVGLLILSRLILMVIFGEAGVNEWWPF